MNMLSRVISMSAAKAAIVTTAMFFVTVPSQAQMACSISLEFTKGGFVVGGSGGSGTLTCDGQNYPLRVGGLRAGLVIGLSKVTLSGKSEISMKFLISRGHIQALVLRCR